MKINIIPELKVGNGKLAIATLVIAVTAGIRDIA
jgi:hypothetical protein